MLLLNRYSEFRSLGFRFQGLVRVGVLGFREGVSATPSGPRVFRLKGSGWRFRSGHAALGSGLQAGFERSPKLQRIRNPCAPSTMNSVEV